MFLLILVITGKGTGVLEINFLHRDVKSSSSDCKVVQSRLCFEFEPFTKGNTQLR